MSRRLVMAGYCCFVLSGGVLWAAPSPVPTGAAVLVAALTIAGVLLFDRSGVLK